VNQSPGRTSKRPPPAQEAVMGQPIPAQHPSVVLRSHYKLVRGLLAIAMAAVLALTAAVVILANDEDELSAATRATPQVQPQPQEQLPAGTRFDGGPDEGTRGIVVPPLAPGTRFDGGPDEGTRGIVVPPLAPGTRFDGGPDEGTRGPAQVQYKERSGGPTYIHPSR
jgi:hypothetical protein